jgi:hexosaminidase
MFENKNGHERGRTMNKYLSTAFMGVVMIVSISLVKASGAEPRGPQNNYGIVPMPLSITRVTGEAFEINADTTIACMDKESKVCAEFLQNRIATATGLKLALKDSGASNAIILRVSEDKVEFPEQEAYTFDSNQKAITITGKSPRGLFYGVQTLFQLLPAGIFSSTQAKDLKLSVDALSIKDKPSMSRIRGLHVDISRHFRTKEEIMAIIDCMAMHKLNTLHLHLTDSEAWRIEIKAYPKLTTVGAIGSTSNRKAPAAFLTQEAAKEICAYAADRHISIIPEIDMPGHMGAAIRAYPELKSAKEHRKPRTVIRIDAEGVDFAKKVLTEINEIFDPEYIHIGCDEVNFGVPKPIYSDDEIVAFAKTITTFIKDDLKKTPIAWDDAFMHGLKDKDMVAHWWRHGIKAWWSHLPRTIDEELNLAKQPFIISPDFYTYFNAGHNLLSTAHVYNWDPFADMFGVHDDTRSLAYGAIACTWGEYIKTMEDFGVRAFPRLAAFSERIWSGGKSENPSILAWPDYRDRVLLPFQLKRYDALGMSYWGKDNPGLLKGLKDERRTKQ